MRLTTNTQTTYVLELNEDQIRWLNGVMQNPLHGQNPDEETAEDAFMRRTFFYATKLEQY